MNKITKEWLKTWNPCADGYKRFIELFPEGATLQEAIDGLVTDGHDDWAWWLFSTCKNAGVCSETTSIGYRNSGDGNSGNWNSGDRNSGDGNSGNGNTGNWNSWNRNSGDWNTGNWNSGDWNTGNWNSGDWNSGDWNSGDWNSGDWNTGNWNSGNGNSGFFNIDTPDLVRVFGRDCERTAWDKARKPDFLFFGLTEWIDNDGMTDDEKSRYPRHAVTGGYLRTYSYKEAFKRSWDMADKTDRMKIKDLPNFDAQIFYEISGIDLREGKDGE